MSETVIITGASAGIGKAAAELFIQKGGTVYNISRSPSPVKGIFNLSADVSDKKAVENAVKTVFAAEGKIDVLINCAGFGISGSIEHTPDGAAEKLFAVNFFGAAYAAQCVIPYMRMKNTDLNNALPESVIQPNETTENLSQSDIPSNKTLSRSDIQPDKSLSLSESTIQPNETAENLSQSEFKTRSNAAGANGYTASNNTLSESGIPPNKTLSQSKPNLKTGKNKGGIIINVGSVAGKLPIPFQAYYSASKAALFAFSSALKAEVKPFGIRVASILPGDVKTNFTAKREKSPDEPGYGERVKKSVEKMERDEQNGLPPRLIAEQIYALCKKNNPPAYAVGGKSYALVVLLAKILPERLISFLIEKLYG
ncbi:MAG: SDR family NAD(P)-dependent oxidoreductase [Clostridiales bacterium]|jgi:short-subunit dehydrogenase|nr:SDR family NAD(P)-dependent oxidoreductase [Clostridiales bacterium]